MYIFCINFVDRCFFIAIMKSERRRKKHMSKIITVANRKGGVGKSVTAFTIGRMLAHDGALVLYVDMDSQANLSGMVGASGEVANVYDMLTGKATSDEAIQWIDTQIHVIAGSQMMATADKVFNTLDAPYMLKEALEDVQSRYDYIIIDTAPALDTACIMALTTCDYVVIPAQADKESLDGIQMLLPVIRKVKNRTNPQITTAGILITRYNSRQNYAQQMQDNIKAYAQAAGVELFTAPIRECVAVRESSFFHQSVTEYAPTATAAQDYQEFIEELKERTKA